MELEPSRRRASLRASDADREQIVSALRQHHSDGRLTVEEFTERMQTAYEARTLGDLEGITRDLPPLPPPLPEEPRPEPAGAARWRFYRHLMTYAWVNGFMILLWLVSSLVAGRMLFFWPVWTLLGWGIALGSHAIRAFGPEPGRPPLHRPGHSGPEHRGPGHRGHRDPQRSYPRDPNDPYLADRGDRGDRGGRGDRRRRRSGPHVYR